MRFQYMLMVYIRYLAKNSNNQKKPEFRYRVQKTSEHKPQKNPTLNTTINTSKKGHSPRALIIKVPEDNAKLLYVLNELQKYQEELSEQEHQRDKKTQTQYSQDRAGEVI